jgi:hypothetical protein
VILSFVLFRDIRSTPRALVTILSMCDLGQAAYFVAGLDFRGTNDAACHVLGALGIWIADCLFLWNVAISVWVFVSTWRLHAMCKSDAPHVAPAHPRFLLVPFHVVAWGFPTLATALAVAFRTIGPTATWCFIRAEERFWRIFALTGPLIFSMVVTLALGIGTIVMLQRIKRGVFSGGAQKMADWQLRVLLVPVLFIVMRIWDVVQRLGEAFGLEIDVSSSSGAWFLGLVAAGDSLQGLCNFFIFVVFVKSVRQRFLSLPRRLLAAAKCCKWQPPLSGTSPLPVATPPTSPTASTTALSETAPLINDPDADPV